MNGPSAMFIPAAAIVLACAQIAWAQAPCLSRSLITAARCDPAPVVDGKLGDGAWKRASRAHFTERPGDLRNRIHTCWDGDFLYVAVWCEEPHMSTMDVDHETVEVFLAPEDRALDSITEINGYYYRFAVTADNTRTAEHGEVDCHDRYYQPWPGAWRSAVHLGPDSWQLEAAIRLEDLGKTPSPRELWGLAFARHRRNRNTSYPSITWWSPLVGDPDVRTAGLHTVYFTHMLGLLRFANSGAVAEEGIGDLFPGRKWTNLAVFGVDDAEAVVRAGNRYYNGEGTHRLGDTSEAVAERARQKLARGVPTRVRWTQRPDEEVVTVEVLNRASGDVIYASGQRYRRPIARDPIWGEIGHADEAEAFRRELEAVVSSIGASDAPYEHRWAKWEHAGSKLRARMLSTRRERLMENGPVEDGSRAYGIAMASPMMNILPKVLTWGRIDYTSRISLQAAGNEMEAQQVIVYSPHRDLEKVRLSWTGLRGASGAIIDRESIWAAPMGYVKTSPPSEYEVSHVGWWPDPILTYLDNFDIVEGDLQSVWYSVRVPRGTRPGTYRGTMTLRPANSVAAVIPVEVEIWDFTLPEKPSLNTAVQLNVPSAYGHEDASPERLAALQEAVERFTWAHRCNAAEYSGPPTPKRSDEPTIAIWAELGVKTFSVFKTREYDLDNSGRGLGLTWEDMGRIIALNLELARKYGLEGQPFVYMPDEAKSPLFPAIEKMARWLKNEFPDVRLMTTERLAEFMREEAAEGLPFGSKSGREAVDWIVVPVGGWEDKHWADNARAQGKQVWWYIASGGHRVPQFHVDESVMEPRLLMGFMAYAYATDGFLYWSMMSEANNHKKLAGGPYTDWDPRSHGGPDSGDNGIGHMIYPGQDGPITCMRMESWLDGMEDYEYCVLAGKRVQELRKAGRAAEADELNAVLAPYADPGNEVVRSLTHYTTDPRVLSDARRKIALEIVDKSGR